MKLSGTVLGFICVLALFACSLILAYLDKKEKAKGNNEKARLLSRTALGLFLAAFVGGVVMTLFAGVQPRNDQGPMTGRPMNMSPPNGQAAVAGIGTIDQEELKTLRNFFAT